MTRLEIAVRLAVAAAERGGEAWVRLHPESYFDAAESLLAEEARRLPVPTLEETRDAIALATKRIK